MGDGNGSTGRLRLHDTTAALLGPHHVEALIDAIGNLTRQMYRLDDTVRHLGNIISDNSIAMRNLLERLPLLPLPKEIDHE